MKDGLWMELAFWRVAGIHSYYIDLLIIEKFNK